MSLLPYAPSVGAHYCFHYANLGQLRDATSRWLSCVLAERARAILISSSCLPLLDADISAPMWNAIQEARLEVYSYSDWYHEGGMFCASRAIASWNDAIKRAASDGFEGVVAICDCSWVAASAWQEFAAYEHELHRLSQRSAFGALCCYSVPRSHTQLLRAAVASHTRTWFMQGSMLNSVDSESASAHFDWLHTQTSLPYTKSREKPVVNCNNCASLAICHGQRQISRQESLKAATCTLPYRGYPKDMVGIMGKERHASLKNANKLVLSQSARWAGYHLLAPVSDDCSIDRPGKE